MKETVSGPIVITRNGKPCAALVHLAAYPRERQTVDLSAYPDLVVIYLGMKVRTLAGIKTLLGLGPQIDKAGAARPEGLLHYENDIIFRPAIG